MVSSALRVLPLTLLAACSVSLGDLPQPAEPPPPADAGGPGHDPNCDLDDGGVAVDGGVGNPDAGFVNADGGGLEDAGMVDAGPQTPECDELSAYDEILERCRPVVGPQTACPESPFNDGHEWIEEGDTLRYVAVGGTGDGSSAEQAAGSVTAALAGLAAEADVTLLFGAGTFEESLSFTGAERAVTLIGLCADQTTLDGGDLAAVSATELASLNIAALSLTSQLQGDMEEAGYPDGTIMGSDVGQSRLKDLVVESPGACSIRFSGLGEGGLDLSRSRINISAIMSLYIDEGTGPVTVSSTHFAGPNLAVLLGLWFPGGDVNIHHNLIGATAFKGMRIVAPEGSTTLDSNEFLGPIGNTAIDYQGPGANLEPVTITNNRFEQISGNAIQVFDEHGPVIIRHNELPGPITGYGVLMNPVDTEHPTTISDNTMTLVKSGGMYLNGRNSPLTIQRNQFRGPMLGLPGVTISGFGIALYEVAADHTLTFTGNLVGQVSNYGIGVWNFGGNGTISNNHFEGPIGDSAIMLYTSEYPGDPGENRKTLNIENNVIGDVYGAEGISVQNSDKEVVIANNQINGPIVGVGIAIIDGYPRGEIRGNVIGRTYRHGIYVGPWQVPTNEHLIWPVGGWSITDNRLLGPIGHDGISMFYVDAPAGEQLVVEGNEIGRTLRSGVSAINVHSPLSIGNNTMLGPIGHDGIYIMGAAEGGSITGNTIQSGQASGMSLRGFYTEGSWAMANNEISDVAGRGIVLFNLHDHASVDVSANQITGARGAAAYAYACTAPISMDGNTFSRTRQAGFVDQTNGSPELVLMGYGVSALDVASLSVTNNVMTHNHVGGVAVDHGQWGQIAQAPHLAGEVSLHIEDNQLNGHPEHQELGQDQDVVVQNRAGGMNITGVQGVGAMNPMGLEVPMCRNVGEAHSPGMGGVP